MSEVKGLSFFSGEIGYTFIPKVACTSIKLGFYKLQKGYSFNSYLKPTPRRGGTSRDGAGR